MKKIHFLLTGIVFALFSCNESWNEYYFGTKVSEETVNMTVAEYLEQTADYSEFYNMLKNTGITPELTKNQQITVWAVNNTAMANSGILPNDTLRMKYHVNHLPFILSDLKDGLRIQSFNGIYMQIAKKDNKLYANASQIVKSVRLKDGVVHELASLMLSRINLYDYLKNLGSDYSIIRDSIFKYDIRKFDRANSKPVSVDKEGNTVYDSVFVVYNPLFNSAEFNSEFKQFTVFLPSNEVLNSCFQTLHSTYKKMGKTVAKSDSVLAFQWIKEAMFYNGILSDVTTSADIKSAFNRVWRTSVQTVDAQNPVYMSNGIIYKTQKLKIPNNVIISRIKSLAYYWDYQELKYPAEGDLYTFKGLIKAPSIYTADATPKPAVMPNYIVLQLSGSPDATEELSVEFPPLERYLDPEDGKYKVRILQVPTGEYNLYMGFWSSGHPYVNIYFNGQLKAADINASLSTPWNYDRVTETEKDLNPVNGVAKWDGLGGIVGVVNVDGDGMASFKIKVEFSKLMAVGSKKTISIYHWAIKPTANNY
jgi:hypothetical protein